MRRQTDQAGCFALLAAQVWISVSIAYKWLAHYSSGGDSALVNRHCVCHTQRWTFDSLQQQRAVDLGDIHAPSVDLRGF